MLLLCASASKCFRTAAFSKLATTSCCFRSNFGREGREKEERKSNMLGKRGLDTRVCGSPMLEVHCDNCSVIRFVRVNEGCLVPGVPRKDPAKLLAQWNEEVSKSAKRRYPRCNIMPVNYSFDGLGSLG
jgi:hypothetical protein